MSHILEAAADRAWNDTSPEGCAARRERMQATSAAMNRRYEQQAEARALYRKTRIRSDAELEAALTNIYANLTNRTTEHAEALNKILLAMDDENNGVIEPELLGVDKRGEYDSQTANVRGRA